MNKKGVIIQGSARSDGNTNKITQYLADKTSFDLVDLKDKEIGQFDYEFKNSDDDFLPLMRDIIENYDTIVFATPVYWYSMSGIMKAFFDRISDLLKTEKDLGRKLRGMNMAMISCSGDSDLVDGFKIPFVESANYLGMNYLGDVHTWVEGGEIPEIVFVMLEIFVKKLIEPKPTSIENQKSLDNEVRMLGYEGLSEVINSVEDPISRQLLSIVVFQFVRRFIFREELPISNFDMLFLANVMKEFCSNHLLIQRILNEEDLEKHYF